MPKKVKDKESQPVVYGYFPSFDYYAHARHPLDDVFSTKSAYISHIRGFMSGIFECCSIIDMKHKLTGKEIKPIRNGSDEAKRVNKVLRYPYQLYRVDYGDNGLRLYFGISPQYRLVDIVAIDLNHTYFN